MSAFHHPPFDAQAFYAAPPGPAFYSGAFYNEAFYVESAESGSQNELFVDGILTLKTKRVSGLVLYGRLRLFGEIAVEVGQSCEVRGTLRLINGESSLCWCGHG